MFFSTPGSDQTEAQLDDAGFDLMEKRYVDDPLGSSALFFMAQRR
jgi:hypothetical protein